MKTYTNLYKKLYHIQNLILAWRKARKHKTRKIYVKEFERDIRKNLFQLREELSNQTYFPKQLKTFIFRDPKTRKISKSDFRDRIIHHALCIILEPIFEKRFIVKDINKNSSNYNYHFIKRFP